MEYRLQRKFDSIEKSHDTLQSFINKPNFDWNYAFKLSDKFRAKLKEHKESIKSEPELMLALLKMSDRTYGEFRYVYNEEEKAELDKNLQYMCLVKKGYIPSNENYIEYFEHLVKEKEAEKLYFSLQNNLKDEKEPRRKLKI